MEAERGRRELKEMRRKALAARGRRQLKDTEAVRSKLKNLQKCITVHNFSKLFITAHNSSQQFTTVHNS